MYMCVNSYRYKACFTDVALREIQRPRVSMRPGQYGYLNVRNPDLGFPEFGDGIKEGNAHLFLSLKIPNRDNPSNREKNRTVR